MYDEALIELAAEADLQLRSNLAYHAPFLARSVDSWLEDMFGAASLAEVFTRTEAFPTLLIPWWLDGSIGERDRSLHRALTYSTMNGYLYIRLIDNLMDQDAPGDVNLLPALSFFHLEFIDPYRRLFGPGHRFWADLRSVWLETADVTLHDATLREIDRSTFERVSARKTGAAKIPVAAVCHYRRRLHLQPRWNDFADAFGRWHQMHNDIFSWRKDAAHGATTFLLSEGRRQLADGTIEDWFIDAGFDWGIEQLNAYMSDLKRIADTLESQEALAYLGDRENSLTAQVADVETGLAVLAGARNALDG